MRRFATFRYTDTVVLTFPPDASLTPSPVCALPPAFLFVPVR